MRVGSIVFLWFSVGLATGVAGCGALVGVDWDRVAVGGADGGSSGGSSGGSGSSGSSGSSGGSSGSSGSSGGSSGSSGSSGGSSGSSGSSGGPITCTPPQVACVPGCCDPNTDPGKPTGVSAGQSDTCAVTTTGKVRCWGSNVVGQLGQGAGADSASPVTANNIPSGAASVATGSAHACAVVSGVFGCWGADGSGQLGFDPTPAGFQGEPPARVKNLKGTTLTITVGSSHSCALVDGTAYCWGGNDYGQIAANLSVASSVTPLAVTQVGTGVVAVGASGVRSCAIVAGGGVACWGGQGGDPPTTVVGVSGASLLAVAPFHTCAVSNGSILCWGTNLEGELGTPNLTDAGPIAPQGVPAGVTAITANGSHTCALAGGSVYCWGSNVSGELGRDTGGSNGLPAQVPGLTGVLAISAGESHTCALLPGNALKCWGRNDAGQLGTGAKTTGGYLPVDVMWP